MGQGEPAAYGVIVGGRHHHQLPGSGTATMDKELVSCPTIYATGMWWLQSTRMQCAVITSRVRLCFGLHVPNATFQTMQLLPITILPPHTATHVGQERQQRVVQVSLTQRELRSARPTCTALCSRPQHTCVITVQLDRHSEGRSSSVNAVHCGCTGYKACIMVSKSQVQPLSPCAPCLSRMCHLTYLHMHAREGSRVV